MKKFSAKLNSWSLWIVQLSCTKKKRKIQQYDSNYQKHSPNNLDGKKEGRKMEQINILRKS